MMPQPILELDNPRIDGRDSWHGCPCHTTLDQETHEPARAAHVFSRQAMMLTDAATFASVSRETRDHAIIDVGKDDVTQAQPFGKMTSSVFVTPHRQSRMPKGRKLVGELFDKYP